MLRDRTVLDRVFFKRITSFFSNPFVNLGIALITSVFFLIIGVSQKIPYYYITKHRSVLSSNTDVKVLKFVYKGNPIKNLYSCDVVFWNNGAEFIDYKDFVNPILLSANDNINIIGCYQIAKSRKELDFSIRLVRNEINLKLEHDEALEQGDGIAIKVYYTNNSKKSADFSLKSRVKGTSKGFRYKNLERFSRTNHTSRLVVGWSLILGLILLRIIILAIVRKPIVFRKVEILLFIIAILLWSYYTYEYIFLAADINWYKHLSR